MAELRFPVMANISYDGSGRQGGRGADFTHPRAIVRSTKLGKRRAALLKAVEFDIVPRLLSAHHPLAQLSPVEQKPPASDDVVSLVALALASNPDAGAQYVQDILERGGTLEDTYLNLIAPAAAYLNQMWVDDERDFAEVTLGLWRLQHILRQFSVVFRQSATKPTGHRALLTLVPGETHELPYVMFLLVLSGEFFRRDGWNIWIEPDTRRGDLAALVRSEWFDVVEFQVNCENRLDRLADQIKSIRGDSLNRSICVSVGGKTIDRHPELLTILKADVLAAPPGCGHSRTRYKIDELKRR